METQDRILALVYYTFIMLAFYFYQEENEAILRDLHQEVIELRAELQEGGTQ